MYFIDFFKGLFNKSHIGTIIWMVLNLSLICAAFAFLASEMDYGIGAGIAFGAVAYLLSLLVALSPIGEFILRFQTGCKKVEKNPNVEARLRPIFDEVYANAKAKNPSLSNNVKLYVNVNDSPNAFATGSSTVCVTTGLLNLSDSDIKGVLGHEFGHLAHKDTYLLQAITIGNLFISIIFFFVKLIIDGIIFFTRLILHSAIESFFGHILMWIFGSLSKVIVDGLLTLIMALWTRLGIAICMASSRSQEYEADKYSCELGYGRFLAHALNSFSGKTYGYRTLWAAISSSHPDTVDRISRINAFLASSGM